MSDSLPALPGGAQPSGDVMLATIAMAAARLAAEQAGRPTAAPIGRDEAETIARNAVVEAFKLFGVNLDSVDSVEAHRATIEHARASKAFWAKATGTIWSGIWSAIGLALIAGMTKYWAMGGGK